MTSATIGQRLKDFIASHGSTCEEGVSEERISDFERLRGILMPQDLKAYFLEMNGTAGDYTYGVIRFWSIDEIQTVAEEIASATPEMAVIQSAYTEPIEDGENFFVFADFMHESQLYAIHLSAYNEPNHIILLDGDAPTRVADSFSEFVELYLTSPESLRLLID